MSQVTRISLTIWVEPDDDGYHAFCPTLKGLHVDGATESEAVQNAVSAARIYLSSMVKRGEALPVGCDVQTTRPSVVDFVRMKFSTPPKQHVTQVDCYA